MAHSHECMMYNNLGKSHFNRSIYQKISNLNRFELISIYFFCTLKAYKQYGIAIILFILLRIKK